MDSESKNITQQELEAIERYLRGDMSKSEHAAIEERMAGDEKFRQAVTDYGMLMEGIETAGLKSRLDGFHAEMEKANYTTLPTDPKKSRPLFKYLVAASVLLAVGLATWYIAFQQSPQEELYAAYFEPDPGLITPMSSTDRYEFYSGMIDYKRGNYNEAIARWEPLLESETKSDTLNYFLGVAHLAQGNQDAALPYLQTSVESGESAFKDEAYYYLGLAYLKKNNRQAAMRALEQSNDERAAKLLADFKNEK